MEQRKWKLGDQCYIADVNIAQNRMRFRVMPARVMHVAGIDRRVAMAQSVNPRLTSLLDRWEPTTEGRPFATQWSAFLHVRRTMWKNSISRFTPVRFEGEAPEMKNLSADIPELGQVVYGLDTERQEIFEAQVGYLRYEFGRVNVGYDQSPGNPEASNVRIKQWWPTRAEAETYVHQHHGKSWAFVSKEELARRTDAEIEKIWSDAMERIKSPRFKAQMDKLADVLAKTRQQM